LRDVEAFSFKAAGSEVRACIRPNRSFGGTIDHRTGQLELRRTLDLSSEVLAVRTPDAVAVRRSLFVGEGLPDGEFLRVPEDLSAAGKERLALALGSDFACYVLGPELAASADDTVLATLDVAEQVRRLTAEVSDRGVRRWEITVDPDRFGEATASAASDENDAPFVPTFGVTQRRDGRVTRIEVVVEGSEGVEPRGWTLDYRDFAAPPDVTEVASSAVESDAASFESVEPASITSCSVPL
jgi:hypothetical protein